MAPAVVSFTPPAAGGKFFYSTGTDVENLIFHINPNTNFPLQCFDTVGWATGRASGL